MRLFGMKEKHGTLLKNTVMLTILQLSTYLLALITIPYQTRVLGPEVYGVLGVATAVMVYFNLIIDFGFLLSATSSVSANRDNKEHLCKVLTCVTAGKMILALISVAVLFVLCALIPSWHSKSDIFILFFISTLMTSLMPDYLYRGMEKMTAITIRTVCIRAFFTVAIFILLKGPEDIYVVPVLNIIGNGAAMLTSYIDLYKRFNIRFCKINLGEIFQHVKSSAFFFFSRIATTAYTALNTVILDIIAQGGAVTGYYTSADKLITTGRNLLSPISDSLYPYMVRHKDFKAVRKILLLLMPPIILFCGVCFIWAEPICKLLLGAEYGPAGNVLRAMLPVAVVTLPNYILGFPTLGAMGLSKHANYSVIFGSALHIFNLIILFLTNNVNMLSLAILVSVAECAVLIYRVVVIVKNRNIMKSAEGSNE